VLASVPTWVTVLQLLAAGVVGGFCVLQWLWWRGERPLSAAWSFAWSLNMSLVLAVGGFYSLTLPGTFQDALVYAHAQLIAAFILVAVPATRAIAGGPSIWAWVCTAGALFAARAVAWWIPDNSLPASVDPDVLNEALLLVPTAVVVTYVVVAVGRTRLTRFGSLVVVAGAESLAIFTAGVLTPDRGLGGTFTALWAIPLAVALEVIALSRIREAQDSAALQHLMRDAVARIANAAWFAKDADPLLEIARDEARTILADSSIEGSLRPIARDRFVTELFSSEKVDHAPQ
jgi:hypothetical protein